MKKKKPTKSEEIRLVLADHIDKNFRQEALAKGIPVTTLAKIVIAEYVIKLNEAKKGNSNV